MSGLNTTFLNHVHSGYGVAPTHIELTPNTSATHGGFIDFHYAGSTDDYTSRIIESSTGVLGIYAPNGVSITGKLTVSGTIVPSTAQGANIGLVATPFGSVNGYRYNAIYNSTNYGSFGIHTKGTTSTKGEAYIIVGNSIATGTAENSQGYLRLYGSNTAYTHISTKNTTTTSNGITLPSVTGALGVMSLSGTTLTITTT